MTDRWIHQTINEYELVILNGYRNATDQDREQMLQIARRSLDNKLSGKEASHAHSQKATIRPVEMPGI